MTALFLTKHINKIALLCLLVSTGPLSACDMLGGAPKTAQEKPKEEAPVTGNAEIKLSQSQADQMHLSTIRVEPRTLPVLLNVPAVVQANPNMTMPVVSLVPGRVEEVHVQHGDHVTKGKLLASIRSDEVGQIESELLSKVLELEAEAKQVQVRMELAKKIYERKKTLFEEKIAARADLEVAENELEQERASLRANADKRSANIEAVIQRLKLFGIERREIERVVRTKEVHHQFEIRAPRTGVITTRDVDQGEMIEAGKAMFVIADLSKVWLTAQLPEKDVSHASLGMHVVAKVEGYPEREFHGVLNFIDSHIEPETRTLPVRAELANSDLVLKPEMFGTLKIETARATSFFLPSKCVQQIGESYVVYIRGADNNFSEAKVEPGRTIGEFVEIKSGLKAGDIVAEEGSLKLLGMALQRLSK